MNTSMFSEIAKLVVLADKIILVIRLLFRTVNNMLSTANIAHIFSLLQQELLLLFLCY